MDNIFKRIRSFIDNIFCPEQRKIAENIKKLEVELALGYVDSILDQTKLSFPKSWPKPKRDDYTPDTKYEWVIHLKKVNGTFGEQDLDNLFDLEWRRNFSSSIYGSETEGKSWTYIQYGDSKVSYSEIQIAVDLLKAFNVEKPDYDEKHLGWYIDELKLRIKNYPDKIEIFKTGSIEEAIETGKDLVELSKEFNHDACIILRSYDFYDGLFAWEVLTSVGLEWGDGDLFHWENENDYGSERHFTVGTTTSPGYFLPQYINEGKMNPKDLVFTFSILPSADPKNVYEAMVSTVKFCQKVMGGILLDGNLKSFNEESQRSFIQDLTDRMKSKGIIPGEWEANRLYN